MGKEINVSMLKLPPKQTVNLDRDARSAMTSIKKRKLENIWQDDDCVDKGKVNNGFLWLLAFVPLIFLLFLHLFVASPLELNIDEACKIWEFFAGSENRPGGFNGCFSATVISIVFLNTVFAAMDEYELSLRRKKKMVNGIVLAMAFFLVPVYLWFRGKPAYITWWCGWMVIDVLSGNYFVVVMEFFLASIPTMISVMLSLGKSCKEKKKNNINDALGI